MYLEFSLCLRRRLMDPDYRFFAAVIKRFANYGRLKLIHDPFDRSGSTSRSLFRIQPSFHAQWPVPVRRIPLLFFRSDFASFWTWIFV